MVAPSLRCNSHFESLKYDGRDHILSNILAELSEWADNLPYWEQAALEKILSGSEFTDEDYDKLLQYLLEDEGLEQSSGTRPLLRFLQSAPLGDGSPRNMIKLNKIYNFININKLVTNQTLSFGPALSAIFGANGAGKSGYVRAIAGAASTLGDKEVFLDVTMPRPSDQKQSLDFEISDGQSNRTIHYEIGQACPELSTFYVFDATSAYFRLGKQYKLEFSPASLSNLKKLADVTDRVRERLQEKIKKSSGSEKYKYLMEKETDASKLFDKIESENDLSALHKLATLSDDEQRRLEELDSLIPKLKSENMSDRVKELTQNILDLTELSQHLKNIEDNLSNQILEKICGLIQKHIRLEAEAQSLSVDQFKSNNFSQIGTEVWHDFIKAAKKLSVAEKIDADLYPHEGDYCLLCNQPLSSDAVDLLKRLWKFLKSDIKAESDNIQIQLNEKRDALMRIKIVPIDNSSVSYRILKKFDDEILNQIITFIQYCDQRRQTVLSLIDHNKIEFVPPLKESETKSLNNIIDVLDIELKELKKKDPTDEITNLESEKNELQYRKLLGINLRKIEETMEKRIWAKKAEKVGGNTRHITAKYNEIFDRTVTRKYAETFEIMLRELKCQLKVKIDTQGRKAETLKKIILETDQSINPERFAPEKILSDGEKRAVALADFLTEVTIDESSCGIILDDPVTSLDFQWKEIIAIRLVEEAKKRQVIIFTHDLHFLYLLKKSADEQYVDVVAHWIKRGDEDDRPGYVYLDNSPAMEESYKKPEKAREYYVKAKEAAPKEQEDLLRQGFGALRTSYEAFIIYDLFNKVVMRFDERISFGRLAEIVWNKEIVKTINNKCELLSRYIEGHLHSDAYSSKKPAPNDLLREIEDFEKIKNELKKLKKTSK